MAEPGPTADRPQGEEIHIAIWPGGVSINPVIDAAVRHYAFEAQCFVVNVTAILTPEIIAMLGKGGNVSKLKPGGGYSAILGPRGDFLAGPLENKEGLIYSELDFDRIVDMKMVVDSSGHYARPDVVRLHVDRTPQRPLVIEASLRPGQMTGETMSILFHDGNRQLQEQFDSRRISDRLEAMARTAFSDEDRSFIESAIYFFLATADAEGRPDCSFKGGPPGFIRVTGPSQLAFPDYDGNGMFKSLGNVAINPNVALMFITMHGTPRRLRVNGAARVSRDDPLMNESVGAQMIVRVDARVIFPNCPRYIPMMRFLEPSPYAPRAGQEPVEPAWKSFDAFKDNVHPRQPTWRD